MKCLSFSVGPTEQSFLTNIEDIVNSALAIDKLVSYITISAAEDYLLGKKIGFCEEIIKVATMWQDIAVVACDKIFQEDEVDVFDLIKNSGNGCGWKVKKVKWTLVDMKWIQETSSLIPKACQPSFTYDHCIWEEQFKLPEVELETNPKSEG
ncbi:Hypothetical predicted protein [Paramuricea clavata]|uniref:Uncharacterized protein n=1 Tax=Paramuricea clavata TaxID=317549 RepID=A0A7D9DBA4_PARCT|nr:Hypothetical predicted protein [Paramuricea clavata]